MNLTILQTLADSGAWQQARDTYFAEKLAKLKDVTKPIEIDVELTAGETYAAKAAAATILEEILNGVDRYANQPKKREITNYN